MGIELRRARFSYLSTFDLLFLLSQTQTQQHHTRSSTQTSSRSATRTRPRSAARPSYTSSRSPRLLCSRRSRSWAEAAEDEQGAEGVEQKR